MINLNEFHITVNQQQLEVIAAGLQELPAKHANPVLKVINEQIQAQIAAAEQAAASMVAAQQHSSSSPSRSDLGYERTSGPSSATNIESVKRN
jgi:hypothetical protein